MGMIRHNAILVTAIRDEDIELAWKEANRMFSHVSAVVQSHSNGYRSFVIAPDGSKEGWPTSDECDAKRLAYRAWLRETERKSHVYLDWVEVQYGGDEDEAIVIDHADA